MPDLLFVTKIILNYVQGRSEEVARLSRKITALDERILFSRPLLLLLLAVLDRKYITENVEIVNENKIPFFWKLA